MFSNIYFFDQSFRNYNWSDFFGDLRQVGEPYIEAQLQSSYADPRGCELEPFFYSILPVTLLPGSCKSFLRSTSLPIVARDYYLSKLFQFLYVPLELKFMAKDGPKATECLEKFLDNIPPEITERLAQFDWPGFYDDTLRYDLLEVLNRLPGHLPVPKPSLSSAKMAKKRWVDENWPDRLRKARGDNTQKQAAHRCGVSEETYKKWEQGVRPPAARSVQAVGQFINDSESTT